MVVTDCTVAQNSSVEILIPNVMVSDGTSGKQLGHVDKDFMNGNNDLIKREVRKFLSLSLSCEDTMRRWQSVTQEECPHETLYLPMPDHELSSLQSHETYMSLVYAPVYGNLLR